METSTTPLSKDTVSTFFNEDKEVTKDIQYADHNAENNNKEDEENRYINRQINRLYKWIEKHSGTVVLALISLGIVLGGFMISLKNDKHNIQKELTIIREDLKKIESEVIQITINKTNINNIKYRVESINQIKKLELKINNIEKNNIKIQ